MAKTLGQVARKGSPIAGVTSNPMTAALTNLRKQTPRRRGGGDARLLTTPGYAGMRPGLVKKELRDDFGGGLAESINKQMVTATATREETLKNVGAGKKQLASGAKTIGEVASIFKQGAQAQAAAASIAKARAVQEATGASDSQTAAFAQQLFMAKLQHKWALDEAAAATTTATEAAGEQMSLTATSLSTQAPTVAAAVGSSYRDVMEQVTDEAATGETVKPLMGDFMSAFVGMTGFDETTAEYKLAMQMFLPMQQGVGLDTAYKNAMQATFGAYDEKGKWLPQAIDAGLLGFEASTMAAREQWVADNPESSWLALKDPNAPTGDQSLHPGYGSPSTVELYGGYSIEKQVVLTMRQAGSTDAEIRAKLAQLGMAGTALH